MTMLLSNDIEPITLEGLDITITTAETPRRVTIERVWLDDIRPRAGPDDAAQDPHAQLSRRREDLDGADRDSRRTRRAGCRFSSATAVS